MNRHKTPRIGLALGSGGAKGLAHIGVLKALKKHKIPVHYIAGSSVGSVIGALYAAYEDIEKLENFVLSFDRKKGLGLIDLTIQGGIIKGKKTEKFLSSLLEGTTFETLKIPFSAVATDINTAESIVFHEGNLVKAIRASIAVPAFFQPLQYKHHLLADGGLSNPVPVDIVTKMGADITIAVNLDSVYADKPIQDIPALSFIPLHSVNLLRHTLAKQSSKNADIIIEPPDVYHIALVGWNYVFDNEKAKHIIKIGEEEAEKSIPAIKHAIQHYHYRKTYIGKFLSFFTKHK